MIRVTIPAPGPWLSANDRRHWAETARLTRAWRATAKLAARNLGPVPTPVDITVTVHRARGGRSDASNLAPTAKAAIDGLVDAGVLPDDSATYVRSETYVTGAPGDRRLVLTISPANEGDDE